MQVWTLLILALPLWGKLVKSPLSSFKFLKITTVCVMCEFHYSINLIHLYVFISVLQHAQTENSAALKTCKGSCCCGHVATLMRNCHSVYTTRWSTWNAQLHLFKFLWQKRMNFFAECVHIYMPEQGLTCLIELNGETAFFMQNNSYH